MLYYTVDWQNLAPVPGSGPESGSGPGPFKSAAQLRGAAATDDAGPDLGPDPGTGAGFGQSTVYVRIRISCLSF